MRPLRYELEMLCSDCGSSIIVKEYQAVLKGPGRIVVCRHCKRPHRLTMDGSQALPRDYQRQEGIGLPPPISAYGLMMPPHIIQTLPFDQSTCYACGVPVKEHQSQPEVLNIERQ